ncbi:MAG: DUF6036 family nucleotidyltransferase [Daejeonella sp.]
MDVFDEELLRFWKICNHAQLKYIMIGGVATNLHGYNRSTEDIDMWIEDTKDNRLKLRKTFKEYGWGDFESLKNMQFVPGWTYFHLNNSIRLDIMTSVKGLEEHPFDYYLNLSSIATIFDVDVPFLHLSHLLDSKKAANRLKDQVDIIELEKIKKIIENEGS